MKTVGLEQCLKRLVDGDLSARRDLLEFTRGRLTHLSERMFLKCGDVDWRNQSAGLFQGAIIRLEKSLAPTYQSGVIGFAGLAAVEMRYALSTLAYHFSGSDRNSLSGGTTQRLDPKDPTRSGRPQAGDEMMSSIHLKKWSEFHVLAGRLPAPHRMTLDLLYYNELPQAVVARLIPLPVRQVRSYWHEARLKLCHLMAQNGLEACSE